MRPFRELKYDARRVLSGHWGVAISVGRSHTVGLRSDGTLVAVGKNYSGQCNVSGLTNIRLPK